MTLLEIDAVEVAYDGKPVVRSAGFSLEQGRIACLLGPSGCGKTTLLRAIAGFEPVRAGRIRLGGEVVSRSGFTLAPERRGVGMVFQDFALFPHLSIADNVAFGLRGWSATRRRSRVDELLELVGLAAYGPAYPHQLSGGQQQRVALARALAPRPRLVLLDEPFSSMDVELREGLAREVRGILEREGTTAVLVTHDQLEAFAMADEIGVMHAGRIAQWGDGYELYHHPVDAFVADFIGQGVLLPGELVGDGRVRTELGEIPVGRPLDDRTGGAVSVLLRPDDVIDDPSGVPATVLERTFRGAEDLYTLALPSGARLLYLTRGRQVYSVGERIGVRADMERAAVFPREAA